jgi:tagatose-6-phosphate ketose/aldose isomerase
MDYLNIEADKLKGIGALDTAKEISGQPELWVDVFHKLMLERKEISEFLKSTLYKTKKIILTGAGTSAYIGFSVEGAMQRNTGINTYSVATTHLVTHPQDYFEKDTPTLLISFARSGNSPESVAAAKFADKYCLNCYHLIITCNKDGDLARFSSKNKNLVFLLPPNSNDKSLAMTGSYTGMLLAAILLSDFDNLDTKESTINTLVEYSKVLLYQRLKDVKNIASIPFKRAVFLGSGPLYGTAMESHLKLQELTDGFVICKNDSYLGFRHGPKAVVDEDTLIVYFFSNNEDVIRYEIDLVNDMNTGKQPLRQIGISVKELNISTINELFVLKNNQTMNIDEEYLSVCYILLGQLLGFFKSLDLNLQPDSPSKTGAISRVVTGVTIY